MKITILLFLLKVIISVRIKQQEKPVTMNVTYEYPWKDLEEQKKFNEEHFKYIDKTKEIEKKITDDMDLLRMMFNIQNTQIYKLREVIEVNKAILKQLEIKTLKEHDIK
jgi:hypothetical protein